MINLIPPQREIAKKIFKKYNKRRREKELKKRKILSLKRDRVKVKVNNLMKKYDLEVHFISDDFKYPVRFAVKLHIEALIFTIYLDKDDLDRQIKAIEKHILAIFEAAEDGVFYETKPWTWNLFNIS